MMFEHLRGVSILAVGDLYQYTPSRPVNYCSVQ